MIYLYSQLKGKIKVGDKVRAVEGRYNPCGQLSNDGLIGGTITSITEKTFAINGGPHSFNDSGAFLEIIETNQPTMTNEREEITWENLAFGDYVKNGSYEHKILARINDIVFLSYAKSYDEANWEQQVGNMRHIEQLKKADYTIIQPTKPKTPRKVTLAEIAEKFGEEVEVVE